MATAMTLEYEVGPSELLELLERTPERVFIVDIRNRDSYAKGHIPGSASIPLETLGPACALLPKDSVIVAYCGDSACGLSLLATLELAENGFNVKRLAGGLSDWRRNGFPVEEGPWRPRG